MAAQLPTPSPSPPPVATPALPAQINAATRKQHVVLNRLIISRLPLALPPRAKSPDLLGRGLAAFAQVFFTFEAAWDEIYSKKKSQSCAYGPSDDQVREWLSALRPEGLRRSARLESDLKHISNRTGLRLGSASTAQKKMLERMRVETEARPHILVAYGWVMYMAIFSGGRWIREQLANAGNEFWTNEPSYLPLEKESMARFELPGFSFLSFDGDDDGEGIKALFKARLAEAEALLTEDERQDVLSAAQGLFEDCIDLVGMLDRAVWWRQMRTRIPVILLCVAATLFILLLYWIDNYGYLH